MLMLRSWLIWPLATAALLCVVGFGLIATSPTAAAADDNANRSGSDLNWHNIIFYRQQKAPDGDTENWGGGNANHTFFMENTNTSCSKVIVLPNPPDDAKDGLLLTREHSGFTCRVKKTTPITIDGGLNSVDGSRKTANDLLHENMQKQIEATCSSTDPSDEQGCEQRVQAAFDSCSDQLGGGSGLARFTKDINQDDLANCMAQKTGLNVDDINNLLASPTELAANSSCDVNGIGWLVCQASKLMAKITDGAFALLKQLLNVPGLGLNTSGGQTMYANWAMMRNIANVIFVMIFMFVIYSQLTGVGLDNYGIKKLLPRLIVAIILTNVSYYICAIMVDITNVLGATLKDLLQTVALPVKPEFNGWNQVTSLALVGGVMAILYLNIMILIPVITSGLLAIAMTIILLIARQAIIIILIIIAPIAFILNVLPNTQRWFGRWWSSFFIILMMYPVISVVYGGSQVAAGVISAATPDQKLAILFALMALGVQTIPFFTVPLLMKAGGGVFERFTGVVNSPTKGVFDRVRKKSSDKADELSKVRDINHLTQNKKGLYGRVTKGRAKRDFAAKYAKQQIGKGGDVQKAFISSEGVATDIAEAGAAGSAPMSSRVWRHGDNFEQAMANKGQAISDIEQSLSNMNIEVENVAIDAESAVLTDDNYSMVELDNLLKNGVDKYNNPATEMARAAAAKELARQGKLDRIHNLLRDLDKMNNGAGPSAAIARATAAGLSQNSARSGAAHLNSAGLQAIKDGSAFRSSHDAVDNLYRMAAEDDAYSPSVTAQQSSAALRGLHTAIERGAMSDRVASDVRQNVQSARTSERLQTQMSGAARREASRF